MGRKCGLLVGNSHYRIEMTPATNNKEAEITCEYVEQILSTVSNTVFLDNEEDQDTDEEAVHEDLESQPMMANNSNNSKSSGSEKSDEPFENFMTSNFTDLMNW